MLFNSLQFCIFFVVVTVLYYYLPRHWQWRMLLFASCAFYMAFVPAYIVVLFGTIVIDYYMALRISTAHGATRRLYLQISIVATCLVLFAFKYFNFFALTVRELQQLLGDSPSFPLANIILPIGLSFHTFQSLSYVIEVYRGKQLPERHFGIYSLYVMFYPQLVAGPIERPQNLLHQFYEEHRFDADEMAHGLFLMAWGFFQKMVVADRAASYVNTVYGNWQGASGLSLLVATLFFAVQIYADFAGYSCIAIGCARVLGFRLMRNFWHPYFSVTVSEFWRRWHISLSTWFKDYVYVPLGGSRTTRALHYRNLMITFTLSGLWHGANWTFVIWGAYNGILLVAESFAGASAASLSRTTAQLLPRRVLTLSVICAGWIFFRAPSARAAISILQRIILETSFSIESLKAAVLLTTGDNTAVAVFSTTVLFIAAMFAMEWRSERATRSAGRAQAFSTTGNLVAVVALFEVIMLFGVLRSSAFIYFQF